MIYIKKILVIILITSSFIFVGCSNKNKSEDAIKKDNTTSTNAVTKDTKLELTDEDIKLINTNLIEATKGTAHENSKFIIEMSQKDTNWIKVAAIKPINDLMNHFNVFTADEVVKSIRASLTFDTAYDLILSSTDKQFKGMSVYIYDNEEDFNNNDFYTLKSISTK